VQGIKVTLYDENGNIAKDANNNIINPTKTDKMGYYHFCGVKPSQNYKIKFDLPKSYKISVKKVNSLEYSNNDYRAISYQNNNITIKNNWVYVNNPTKSMDNIDIGIYCDCSETHDKKKDLNAPALNIVGVIVAIISILYFASTRRENEV
jgi:hypothetical protein